MRLPQRRTAVLVFAVSIALTALISSVSLRAGAQPAAAAPVPLSFNRDIRPILANNCFTCHGPDEKKRETDFHFDTKEGMFLEEGIIVPGNAARSVLVKKITEPDPKDRMPPPDSGHALTDAQIVALVREIAPADVAARVAAGAALAFSYASPSGAVDAELSAPEGRMLVLVRRSSGAPAAAGCSCTSRSPSHNAAGPPGSPAVLSE